MGQRAKLLTLTLLLLVIVMARGRGMDTSTGADYDARNAPTPLGAVSSSIPIVLLPLENLLLEMDVDTRVRPYQPGRDTGYIIGGGAAPPTLLIPLLDQLSGSTVK